MKVLFSPLSPRRKINMALAALALMLAPHPQPAAAEAAQRVAAPVLDETSPSAGTETAVLAGGCFWGVQGVFEHVEGVRRVLSGYAGGERATAQYYTVAGGATGHAEAVRVEFDPRRISYGRILQIYFSAAHDPTQHDRQGPDVGSQYRSAIFPVSAEQEKIARAYIPQLDQTRAFPRPLATRVEPDKTFYPAESYHQDYLTLHPDDGYIVINDLPKIRDLQTLFPEIYRAEPVLVGAAKRD